MRKIPHDRMLSGEPKEQHLNTVPKFYLILNIVKIMLWR